MKPTKLKLGTFTYKIRFTKKIPFKGMKNYYGATHHKKLVIYINSTSSPDLQRETLMHEVMHCLWFISGLDHMEEHTEEQAIRMLSPYLMEVAVRNKKLVRYLQND